MKESFKIFEDDKVNKLEEKVNEFIQGEHIVLVSYKLTNYLKVDKQMFVLMLSYQDWSDEELSPKKNKSYKFKDKK